jgi:dienelactone hydrolase
MISVATELSIPFGDIKLKGDLFIPDQAHSIILFSHGSGNSRYSPRNSFISDAMNRYGFATLLIDLLTEDEVSLYENCFDIQLLADRLIAVTEYVHQWDETSEFSIGYFGASTGAASAFKAARKLDKLVGAIVCRGGRPDLVMQDLSFVHAPTLLLVGSLDSPVLLINQASFSHLCCIRKIIEIDGASHLFEEEGKLDEVARYASAWFKKYLS